MPQLGAPARPTHTPDIVLIWMQPPPSGGDEAPLCFPPVGPTVRPKGFCPAAGGSPSTGGTWPCMLAGCTVLLGLQTILLCRHGRPSGAQGKDPGRPWGPWSLLPAFRGAGFCQYFTELSLQLLPASQSPASSPHHPGLTTAHYPGN